MALVITATQEAEITIDYRDRLNNPAIVDGTPVWSVSNSAVLEVVPTDNPFVVVLKAVGALGTSQVTAVSDADLTEGTRDLVALDEVTVVASEAVNAAFTFGTPREQTPAAPDAPPVDPTVDPTV